MSTVPVICSSWPASFTATHLNFPDSEDSFMFTISSSDLSGKILYDKDDAVLKYQDIFGSGFAASIL